MKRPAVFLWLAFLWLAAMLTAGSYLSLRIVQGLHFHTDLMALLPREQQDPAAQNMTDAVTQSLAQRVLIVVGAADRNTARASATDIAQRLNASGLFDMGAATMDKDRLRSVGTFYFPYRAGLLTADDRNALQAGQGNALAARALAQTYGMFGLADGKLLQNDPFLLLPHFLTSLPVPASHFAPDDGLLSLQENGRTWILLAAQLKGDPFALEVQKQAVAIFNNAKEAQQNPDLTMLHLGAVFFAQAGADSAMRETSIIGIVSAVGTALLVLLLFRTARPLLLCLLVIATGITAALAASLLIFGEMHIIALLFGISLIGVSVDYSLQYCCEAFAPPASPQDRLRRVRTGISIGTATTVIGYLTLCLAPFPGLHQIAIFSAVGLVASWLTVVLWLPMLDQKFYSAQGQKLLQVANSWGQFWQNPAHRHTRFLLALVVVGCVAYGYSDIHADDDVRHMQSLSASLTAEQQKIQSLAGPIGSGPFLTVNAPDAETALQREELLADHLRSLIVADELAGFQSVAQYIPSQKRQTENRALQRAALYDPLVETQADNLHLAAKPSFPDENILKLDDLHADDGPMIFLSPLMLGASGQHAVMLQGVTDRAALQNAIRDIPGVRLVDPTRDYSNLFGKYRQRAVLLLALSALLMLPLLIWHYGFTSGLQIMLPSLLALICTPALRAMTGAAFTFFDAMALVLILSIGVDYAVFCAETSARRRSVTLLAVAAAACAALLSFGLLALSSVDAVHHFGMSMTIGIMLSFLFAPLASLPSGNWPRKLHCLLPLLSLLLPSCADAPLRAPLQPVVIAPGLSLNLPDPSSLNRPVEATQLVVAHYAGQDFAFEAHISANANHFLFAGLDPMGRTAMRIDWTPEGILVTKSQGVPDQLQPEHILADLVLLYWPEKIVRQSLSTGQLTSKAHQRSVTLDHKTVWQATYAKTDPWAGALHYRSFAYDYIFDVQSVEGAP